MIGIWNVRSMYQGGKAITIANEMQRYNLQVLGLCETRWTQAGQTRLATAELILYSGHTERNAHHTEGVGFMKKHRRHLSAGNRSAPGESQLILRPNIVGSTYRLCSVMHQQTTIGSDNRGYSPYSRRGHIENENEAWLGKPDRKSFFTIRRVMMDRE